MSRPFPWRAGMRFRTSRLPDYVATVERVTNDGRSLATAAGWSVPVDACTPVDSGPTRGALLDAVREVWARPDLWIRSNRAGTVWSPDCIGTPEVLLGIEAPTELAALLAAYSAAPEVPRG